MAVDFSIEKAKLTESVDILTGAPRRFLDKVVELETTIDFHERGEKAARYITENGGLSQISYEDLIRYLTDPSSAPISIWRQLYLLERSIPPRNNAEQISWFNRLKIFADTYQLEHVANGKKLNGLPGKIRFSRKSGDHDNLHIGAGNYAADFYCWDEVLDKFHGFVELKHWGSQDIAKAMEFYSDKHYDAMYVLVFLKDGSCKLLDYKNNAIIDQAEISAPTLLYW